MYYLLFPAVVTGLVRFLYESWLRALAAGSIALVFFVAMIRLITL